MLKPFISSLNKIPYLLLLVIALNAHALKSDKEADFELDADNFLNLPQVKDGITRVKFWDNVAIQQGTLKIHADEAVVFKGKDGLEKIKLKGDPIQMEQFIDASYGKINIKAQRIDFMMKDDMLLMTGDVIISSKIQGQMHGEKISMNLKTKEIKGIKSEDSNNRVRLVIPGKK